MLRNMKMKAARYYQDSSGSAWEVALYPADTNTQREPHNWEFLLSKRQFNSLGLTCPRKNKVVLVELRAKLLGDAKESF